MSKHRRKNRRRTGWARIVSWLQPALTALVWAARLAGLVAVLTGHRD